ncbi:hypothetical protein C8F01DRAFT_1082756 [Mycena amicta]|nr:hypothetical protein C8F01DRAFT_1082756 [Mycena amicta]
MSGARNRALRPSTPPPTGKNGRAGAGGRSPDLRASSGGALALAFNDEGSGTNDDCVIMRGRQSTFSEASQEQRNFTGRQSEQNQQRQESRIVKSATLPKAIAPAARSQENTNIPRTTAPCAQADPGLLRIGLGRISPRKDADIEFETSLVHLNDHVGNSSGELIWGWFPFRRLVQHHPPRKNALCSRRIVKDRDKPEEYVEARLNSDDHIAQRKFEAIQPDPAFTEMTSSAHWINLTVITQPDMRGFLKNKEDAIGGVARRAVVEVMNRAVEEAMVRVTAEAEAEEYVQMEMDTLIKSASMAKTGAYAGLAQLHVMGSLPAEDCLQPVCSVHRGAPDSRGEHVRRRIRLIQSYLQSWLLDLVQCDKFFPFSYLKWFSKEPQSIE